MGTLFILIFAWNWPSVFADSQDLSAGQCRSLFFQNILTYPSSRVPLPPRGKENVIVPGSRVDASEFGTSLRSENFVTETLAAFGFAVIQNPFDSTNFSQYVAYNRQKRLEGLEWSRTPDLLVESKIFDVMTLYRVGYVQSIVERVLKKIRMGQTHRVIIDLRYEPAFAKGEWKLAELSSKLHQANHPNLWEVMVVFDRGSTIRLSRIYPITTQFKPTE